MHPIEMLRAVARSRQGPPGELAAEAAWGLAALASEEPAAVLPACRRLLERQPACGPLWWLSARVLTAGDPASEADRCSEMLTDDRTSRILHRALKAAGSPGQPLRAVSHGGIGEVAAADIVVVEVNAIGPTSMVLPASRIALLRAAEAAGTPVWVESGVGRLLPPKLWDALEARVSALEHGSDVIAPLESVQVVVGPNGTTKLADLVVNTGTTGCPEPSELIAGW